MRTAKMTQSKRKSDGYIYNYPIKGDGYELLEVDCTFHQFAQEGEEGNNYPVAIIEFEDGTVYAASLHAIRFTDKLLSTTGDKSHVQP